MESKFCSQQEELETADKSGKFLQMVNCLRELENHFFGPIIEVGGDFASLFKNLKETIYLPLALNFQRPNNLS